MPIFITVCILILAVLCFWIFAIAPRLKGREDFSALKGFDYAHRGLHGEGVPENSLTAFKLASESGFGMELDLQLSKDGFVVVHHDNSLKRICGVDKLISDLTLKELLPLRLYNTGEGVPLFTDVLKTVACKTPIIVELKGYGNINLLCEKTWEILKDYKGLYCIESFNPLIVEWFKENQPQIIRGQLMSGFKKGDEGLSAIQAFAARNMLTNLITRPDFEAYNYQNRNNISLRLAKKLFKMQEVSWTVRDAATHKKLKSQGSISIFEGFDPRG